jgi:hypothetical protein
MARQVEGCPSPSWNLSVQGDRFAWVYTAVINVGMARHPPRNPRAFATTAAVVLPVSRARSTIIAATVADAYQTQDQTADCADQRRNRERSAIGKRLSPSERNSAICHTKT